MKKILWIVFLVSLAPCVSAQVVPTTLAAQQHGGGSVTLGPIVYDYTTEGPTSCSSTCSFATPASVQVGDTLIACYVTYSSSSLALAGVTGDGTWSTITTVSSTTGVFAGSCMHNNSATTSGAVSLTFTLSAPDTAAYLQIFRYKGGNAASYFGAAVINNGASTTAPVTPSISPGGSANLVFTLTVPQFEFEPGSIVTGTGFTSPLFFSDLANSAAAFSDARSVPAGTYQATLLQSNASGTPTSGVYASLAMAFSGFTQVAGGCEDSTIMNGSGGTNSANITTGTLTSSTLGLNVQGTWSMSGTAPTWSTVTTLGPKNAYRVCGGGTSLTANSSPLAWTITGTGSAFASAADLDICPVTGGGDGDLICGYNNMYALCWVNDNFTATDTSDIDTCGLTASPVTPGPPDDFVLVNWYGNATNRYVQLETAEGNSAGTISVNSGSSVCPCALLVNYVSGNGVTGGTSSVTVYNASGVSIGTLTKVTAVNKFSATKISIGNSKNSALTTGKVWTETSIKIQNGTAPSL